MFFPGERVIVTYSVVQVRGLVLRLCSNGDVVVKIDGDYQCHLFKQTELIQEEIHVV